MLHNTQGQTARMQNVLDEMEKSPFNFWLTGSRFFGTAKPESDWDFYASATEHDSKDTSIRTFLAELGFFLLGPFDYNVDGAYNDDNCAYVYRWRGPGTEQIDVQLQENVDLKHKAQELLRPYLWKSGLKDYQKNLWNLVYRAIKDADTLDSPAKPPKNKLDHDTMERCARYLEELGRVVKEEGKDEKARVFQHAATCLRSYGDPEPF